MAHFVIDLDEGGTVQRILRDGAPDPNGVRLEQLFSVVTTYFRLAQDNLRQLSKAEDDFGRRGYGLQVFLMSLTGLEAFTNTYFHLRGQELKSPALLARLEQTHGALAKKLRELVALTGDPPMRHQDALLTRIYELSQLRNEIVHPRWVPSSVLIPGPIVIEGLVENRQSLFEDEQFCQEAMYWCLLVIARIAEARGNDDVSGFMFHWTGSYGLSLAAILGNLGLAVGE